MVDGQEHGKTFSQLLQDMNEGKERGRGKISISFLRSFYSLPFYEKYFSGVSYSLPILLLTFSKATK